MLTEHRTRRRPPALLPQGPRPIDGNTLQLLVRQRRTMLLLREGRNMRPSEAIVTVEVTDDQLAETDYLRTALEIPEDDATAVAQIEAAIKAATLIAENYCGIVLRRERIRAMYYISGRLPMFLTPPKWPLEMTFVNFMLDGQDMENETYIDTARLIRRTDQQPFSGEIVDMSITQGFNPHPGDNANVPPDLSQAVTDIARQIYLSRDRSPDVRFETLTGVAQIGYDTNPQEPLPVHAASILNRYSRLGVAL